MRSIVPPLDPGQLPPDGEDDAFVNATAVPVGPVTFQAFDGGMHPPVVLPVVLPGQVIRTNSGAPYRATRVTCEAAVSGQIWRFEFDETPPGSWIAAFVCGLADGHDDGFVPFGQVVVTDGTTATAIALV